jgi:hypothetical protein
VSPGLGINVDGARPGGGLWLTTVREGLTIEGRGATLVGKPLFVAGGSASNTFNVDRCNPPPLGGEILVQSAYSLARADPGAERGHQGVSLGSTLQQSINSAETTLNDIDAQGHSFNWSFRKHNGCCNGNGAVTELKNLQ